jgi:hypothetical protein
MKKIFLAIIFPLITSIFCFAQSTLLMLNGNEYKIKSYEVKGEYLIFKKADEKSNTTGKYNLDRVYSVTDSTKNVRIFYYPDTTDDYELNIGDMRTFIDGEQYAMKHYKKPMNAIAPAVVGLTAAGFIGVYALVVPFGYVGLASAFSAKVPLGLDDEPSNINDPMFKEGYQYKARKKKAKDGFIFGGLGVVVGLSLFLVFAN